MFNILIATLFLALFVSAQNNTAVKINSIEEYWSVGCLQTSIVYSDSNGYVSFACIKPKNPNNKHKFGTDLFTKAQDGSYEAVRNTPGALKDARFGGYVHSAWGTFRAVAYPGKDNVGDVVDFAKNCDKEETFCFDDFSDVCIFEFSGKTWEKPCPNLQVISFEVDS